MIYNREEGEVIRQGVNYRFGKISWGFIIRVWRLQIVFEKHRKYQPHRLLTWEWV